MSYSLDPAKPVTAAVRAVGLGELDIAQSALSPPSDFHSGVHNARKALKRLRSLIWLVRPGLPQPLFAHLDHSLKATAKELAPARDAQALVDTVDGLGKKAPRLVESPAMQGLRSWLSERRDEAERRTKADPAAKALRDLKALRTTFGRLSIYPDDFGPLSAGLKASYRDARKAGRAAFSPETDEALHEWRKLVQRHWRQIQLLTPCAPETLTARADHVHKLAQLLGDDHDLANLRQLLAAPVISFGDVADRKALAKRCRQDQETLRQEARVLGARLFAERPKVFAERIETLWQAAVEATSVHGAAAASNVVPFGVVRDADLKIG
jgi:CHAD domain-containing protein